MTNKNQNQLTGDKAQQAPSNLELLALNESKFLKWLACESEETEAVQRPVLEVMLQQQMAMVILQDLSRNAFVELIAEVFHAQGLTTLICKGNGLNMPEIDLLASGGLMGFGGPNICLKLRYTVEPIDRLALDEFNGLINKYHADYGILVSVNGFRTSFQVEQCREFFKIRFWDMQHVIQEILEHYPKFSPRAKSILPLQQVWVLDE